MDLTNATNKRIRFDTSFDRPMTLEDWRAVLDMLESEEYESPPDWYAIKKFHSVLIKSESLGENTNVTIYATVDLGENMTNKQERYET